LNDLAGLDPSSYETTFRIQQQQFSLKEFLEKDPSKNLAARMPNIVMNAAEYQEAMIKKAGVNQILTPYSRDPVFYYKFFSDGAPELSGRRIIGQWDFIHALYLNIQGQAKGLRAGQYPLLGKGPPGTGKSEIADVFPGWMRYWSAQVDPKLAFVTFRWVNLNAIQLPDFVNKYPDSLKAPTDASPLGLLPEPVRDFAVKMATPSIEEMIDRGPNPRPILDSQSTEIRTAILTYYEREKNEIRKQNGLKPEPLTLAEIMDCLNKHVIVQRVIIDRNYKSIIDSQGQDVDVGSLFGTPNPVNRMLDGPQAPASWHLNGALNRNNRKTTIFDEVMTNSDEFLKMFLGMIESRRISIAGPSEETDQVFMGFTNDVDFNKKMEKGHTALGNRWRPVALRGSVFPRLIEDTLYYSVSKDLYQKPIAAADDAEWTPYNHEEVVPVPKNQNFREPFPGPERRYRLALGKGKDQVYIAPHVGRLISDFVAMTRYVTNPDLAKERAPASSLVSTHEFTDPLARVQMYHGESAVNADQYFDMIDLGNLLEEGSSLHPGLLTRDALKLWMEVLLKAKEPIYQNTVTPALVLQVFEAELKRDAKGGFLSAKSNEQRLEWESLMQRLKNSWLVPTLANDVKLAHGQSDHGMKLAYREFLEEMKVIHESQGAAKEFTFEGRTIGVNKERMEAINKIYKQLTGKDLSAWQIGRMEERSTAKLEDDASLHSSPLFKAVVLYYDALNEKARRYDRIFAYLNRNGRGVDDSIKEEGDSFIRAMNELGYNRTSALIALKMVSEMKQMTGDPKPSEEK
jgi:hypothetical protein